jgi:DNA-binding SARP family transcriptional activator
MIGFSILGPLTAELAGPPRAELDIGPPRAELDIGPLKQRLLLALLLCRCNGVVLVDDLVDTLWWDGPPRTAHKNIQVYITHLRKFLADAGQPGRLRFRPPGYQLRLSAANLDALLFEERFRAGRLALRDGDARAAAAAMRQAIGLWRGQPLEDLQISPVLRAEAARLSERKLAAYEDWFEAELLLGNQAQVLDEIDAVVRAHPLRERLRGQQLTALYQGGRQAEALAEYDNLRQLLAAELGLGPSPALQQLYQGILSGRLPVGQRSRLRADPPAPAADDDEEEVVAHMSGPAPAAVDDGLPRDPDDFTGRAGVLRDLLSYFGYPGPGTARWRRLAAVVGPPGAGSTTLALRAANLLAPGFRDGAMLLPLCAADGTPRPPAKLAADLLARTGEPAGPRGDTATVLRGRLAGRQLLLVLDGAVDEGQVRPLLPGAGDCSVIVTSCRHLGGLDGVTRFPVGLFTEAEALELLGRVIGAERIGQDVPAATRIVRACGLLPLAVRIAAARLAALPHLPLDRFAGRLEDPGQLLDELATGDLSLRARFDRYRNGLDPAERFALLQVAAAYGPTAGELERLLERLAEVHALTITTPAPARAVEPPFIMASPLWVYARQLIDGGQPGT